MISVVDKANTTLKAFTLAEVLIVLGIIGLIADMTIPTLMNNVQNQQLEAGFKSAYSTLSQAFMRMSTEEGPIYGGFNEVIINDTENKITLTRFAQEFQKYFKGVSFHEGQKQINTHKMDYRTFNGKAISYVLFDDGYFEINNGMSLYFECPMEVNTDILITVDINGYKKKPNKWGYDIFTFAVTPKETLMPIGSEEIAPSIKVITDTDNMETYCSDSSSSGFNGLSCSYRAMTEKDYFKNLK